MLRYRLAVLCSLCACSSAVGASSWLRTPEEIEWMIEIEREEYPYGQIDAMNVLFERVGSRIIPVVLELVRVNDPSLSSRGSTPLSLDQWDTLGYYLSLYYAARDMIARATDVDLNRIGNYLRLESTYSLVLMCWDRAATQPPEAQVMGLLHRADSMQREALLRLGHFHPEAVRHRALVMLDGLYGKPLLMPCALATALETLLVVDPELAGVRAAAVLETAAGGSNFIAASVLARSGREVEGIGALIEDMEGLGRRPNYYRPCAESTLRELTGQYFAFSRFSGTGEAIPEPWQAHVMKWRTWFDECVRNGTPMVLEELRVRPKEKRQ